MSDKTKTLDEQLADRIAKQTKGFTSELSSVQSSLNFLWLIVLCGLVAGTAYSQHLNEKCDRLSQPAPQVMPEQTYQQEMP